MPRTCESQPPAQNPNWRAFWEGVLREAARLDAQAASARQEAAE